MRLIYCYNSVMVGCIEPCTTSVTQNDCSRLGAKRERADNEQPLILEKHISWNSFIKPSVSISARAGYNNKHRQQFQLVIMDTFHNVRKVIKSVSIN